MAWGTIAAAAIGAGASILGARAQNKAAEAASARQMEFQRETLQHQYQWAMDDMRKAGLNPMLAYQQGGAGSAGGSTFRPVNVAEGVPSAVNSAFANMKMDAEIENLLEMNKNLFWDTQKKQSETFRTDQEAANLRKTHDLIETTANTAKAAEARARHDAKFWESDLGKFMATMDKIGSSLNPFTQATGGAGLRYNPQKRTAVTHTHQRR